MNVLQFIILLVIAGVCGAAGQAVTGYTRGGCFVSIAVGLIGALLGTWLARELGLPMVFAVSVGGSVFPIVWSVIGAALFVAVLGLVSGRRT